MDMLKSFASGGGSDKPGSENSSSDLFGKAKLVAEAAQATLGNESDKVDKPKVASAAADLLEAGEKYGKIDSTSSMGQYLDKAEDYLHKYGSSAAPAAQAKLAEAPAAPAPVEEAEKPAPPPAEAPAAEPPAKKEEESGVGDVIKMAGGFFK